MTYEWRAVPAENGWRVVRRAMRGKSIVYTVPEPGTYANRGDAESAVDLYTKGKLL